MNNKKDIRTSTNEELLLFCTNNNLPKFRAKQISEWLWKKRAVSFKEMTSLSLEVRKYIKLIEVMMEQLNTVLNYMIMI